MMLAGEEIVLILSGRYFEAVHFRSMSKTKDDKHRVPTAGASDPGASESQGLGEEQAAIEGAADPRGQAGGDGAAKAAPNSELEALRAQVAEKEREIAELKDKYLRALADGENARKRIRQQSEENIRLQRENLLRELLPIIDNLERAVDAARGGGNGKPIVEGVEMVLRSLLDLLRRHGVTPQEAIGQPFNPQFHEAADHIESDQYAPNTVIREFHRGYQIGERVLRPARVVVAKGRSDGSGEQKDGEGGDGSVESQ
jgi:molecular chaperone GrpE